MASPRESVLEAASSPVRDERGKSFVSHAATDDEDTKMMDVTIDLAEKSSRSKSKSSKAQDPNQSSIGKIRHLKKEDGEPLWRKDIQYDFLKAIFDDEKEVFTNSYDPEGISKQCFADLYIDTMARSSKTSKVLRDKLLSDREAAKGMAMVCLLVNIGRMNTTLNFFPEMRAQLRTYHAIPSLQAHQDANAYKQLQDAPRLKSILKGSMEDRTEPTSLVAIKELDVPRTNPVNLLFVICQSAQKIAELHFPHGQEFHDLVMKTNYTSYSRARAFLWIMWFYLESDFTEEGCDENPFGPGVDYGLQVANQGVPRVEVMSKEEEDEENVDTPEEIEFGHMKQKMRAKILEVDQAYLAADNKRTARHRALADEGPAILPRIRPSKHESDLDSVRSTPPPNRSMIRQAAAGSTSRRGGSTRFHMIEGSSPSGSAHVDGVAPRKPRPPTAHQLAVERHRKEQVDHILDRGIRKQHHKARRQRRQEGVIYRAMVRIQAMPDDLAFSDSDVEDDHSRNMFMSADKDDGPFLSRGPGGLCQLKTEVDDFGEETSSYGGSIRRAVRRLSRWGARGGEGVVAPVKRKRAILDEEERRDREEQDINGVGEHPASEMNGHHGAEDGDADGEEGSEVGKRRKTSPEPGANGDVQAEEQENDDGAGEIVAKSGVEEEDGTEKPEKVPSPAEDRADAD
ncbi:related to Dictyostelium protein kinase [Cephalotrichum gorgonifer]|uniref:Related to Dictyostelium protein kinase n=1 Tax=Cephalotrichum gorgonifer TaxID=2041049 RepID=A0AAE8MRA1_9PEZI|nr:related to Dictyostelium protein kinase [Cephalotrichum gorgonifer]